MSKHLKRCTWIVAGVLLLLYVARVGPHWKIGRDSSLYLGIAQSLAEGRGFRFQDMPFDNAPFGLPLLLSAVWSVLGPNYLAMNALMAGLALATLWFVYRSVREIAGPWWGLIVLLLTGLSYRMMQFSGQLMTDLPAMFGFWAGFYFLQRVVLRPEEAWSSAAGAAAGLTLGCTFRFSTPFVGPVFALAPWLRRRADGPGFGKRALLSGVTVLPAVLLFAVWLHQPAKTGTGEAASSYWTPTSATDVMQTAFAQWPKSLLFVDAVFESVTTQATGADVLLTPGHRFATRDLGPVALLGLTVFWLGLGAAQVCRKDRCLSLLTLLCYGGGVTAFAFEPNPRYLLPMLPLLWWFAAEGLQTIWRWLRRLQPAANDTASFPLGVPVVVALALLLIPNTAKALREVRLAHATDFYAVYDRGHWKPYLEAARWIESHTPSDARLFGMEGSTVAVICRRLALRGLEQCRPGDLLLLEPLAPPRPARGIPDLGRQKMDALLLAVWRVAESDAAKEVFRSGNLRLFQIQPTPTSPPAKP